MELSMVPKKVIGLEPKEQAMLEDLISIYEWHKTGNAKKARYYDGDIPLRDVNLGLALPKDFKGLEIGCAWGSNTVDVLASRSMFDGFVGENGNNIAELDRIVRDNKLVSGYKKQSKDELTFGFTNYTFSADKQIGCRIRTHSPQTSAVRWNGQKGRIDCGMAIIDTVKDESAVGRWRPSIINLYTEDAIYVIQEVGYRWIATKKAHKLGRPMIEPLIWDATSSKPLGQSRLKRKIRRLIDGYIRTVANATIGLEFATSPQKYLFGVTDKQYDALIDDKFKQYIGSLIVGTTNPETGQNPVFGQLPQGTIEPHVAMLRTLSTQFSAATGLTVTDTGVVNEANPTSSEAIIAQSQTLIKKAEELNEVNGDSLKTVAHIALAVANGTTIEKLPEEQKNIVAHFKNPAMPSVAVTADAAIKIAGARKGFADTDVFLEMIGFDQADIRRIKAQEQRSRGQQILTDIEDIPDEEEPPAGE